jgi:hypothetical protein
MAKRFVVPFASTGDKTVTPDATDPAGAISYSQGWGSQYQLPDTDPSYRPVGRQEMNGVLFDVTGAIAELQTLGFPIWVPVAGLVSPYEINAYVRHNNVVYRNTIANNSAAPDAVGSLWADVSTPVVPTPTASGSIGLARNLKTAIAAASSSATYTADELVVKTSLGAAAYSLAAFSKSINLASVGVGGMDAGAAPVNGYVGVYAIFNPSLPLSGTNPALLAVNATALASAEVYSGPSMPAGYTASALISVLATNGSGQFKAGQYQIDRKVTLDPINVLTSVLNTPSFTLLSIASAVPLNAKFASLSMQAASTAAGAAVFQLASTSTGVGARQVSGANVLQVGAPAPDVALLTPQTVWRVNQVSTGTTSFQSFVIDYSF